MVTNNKNIPVAKAAVTSSILEILYTHPIDVIKTHQQNKVPVAFNSTLCKGILSRSFGIVPIRTSFWTGLHISRSLNIQNPLYTSLFVSLIQTALDTPIENAKIKQIYNLKKYTMWRGWLPHYMRNTTFLFCFIQSNQNIENTFVSGFVGGLTGAIVSHPFDYYKTLQQSYKPLPSRYYYQIYNGLGARMAICALSMSIGNWSYNYLLDNVFT